MAGIIKGIAFSIDRQGINKMQSQADWDGGDLFEVHVTEEGTVSINRAVVFVTEYAKSQRELEVKEMQATIDRLNREAPVR
jgi:hypothetical protein